MFDFFFNPWLLAGLAGLSLPVIAHLLSRRKYDVVEWGAMQFLQPSRKTRRKLRLEELLLLLIRIATIALIVFGLSRPWIPSGFLLGYQSSQPRDVVIVIDGSNSMARSNGLSTLHQKAVRRAQSLLQTLRPGDNIGIIDARDLPLIPMASLTNDRSLAENVLDALPPPAGAGDLYAACEQAVGMLSRASSGSREVIVFTDRQRYGWDAENSSSWQRFDELKKFSAVEPRLWIVDLSGDLAETSQNVSVTRVQLSRDLAVPDSPVTLTAEVRNSGTNEVRVPLQVLVNGQQLSGYDSTLTVAAGNVATYAKPIRFAMEGVQIVTVEAIRSRDSIEIDNKNHAAIRIADAIPVLAIEPELSPNPSEANSFFAELALTTPQNDAPWILCEVVDAGDFTRQSLIGKAAVILPDVSRLDAEACMALAEYVATGGGVLMSLAEDMTPTSFQRNFVDSGLMPRWKLTQTRKGSTDVDNPTTIAPYSLSPLWLERFRSRQKASLFQSVFDRWWLLEQEPDNAEEATLDESIVMARYSNNDPWLYEFQNGDGRILLMTSSLNTEWNTFPASSDYVPFLHEAIFHLVAARIQRNVTVGDALLTSVPKGAASGFQFKDSFERRFAAEVTDVGADKQDVRLRQATVPGVYDLIPGKDQNAAPVDRFVVDYNHQEDDPASLTDDDRAILKANNRVGFATDFDELTQLMYGDEARSEIWSWLLWGFLALLCVEVWMTRRLVLQGHADVETSPA